MYSTFHLEILLNKTTRKKSCIQTNPQFFLYETAVIAKTVKAQKYD